MKLYHYVECGLDDVHVEGLKRERSPYGGDELVIPAVNKLHSAIAEALLGKAGKLNGREIKYLRVMIQVSQQEFGASLAREGLAVSRWERGETTPDACTETVLRQLVAERLGVDLRTSAAALVDRCREKSDLTITLYRTETGYSTRKPRSGRPDQHAAAA